MNLEAEVPAQGELNFPPKGDLHLWFVRLRDPSGSARWNEILSVDECERADRFRNPESRARFICTRTSLRHLLSAYLDIPANLIPLEVETEGKPVLSGVLARQLSFNLSHSGGWGLLGFSGGSSIGVDIEEEVRFRDILGVASRVLSADEVETLRGLSPHQRENAFFRGWTRKEALLKARGTGIWNTPSQFAAGFGRGIDESDRCVVRESAGPRTWVVQSVDAPTGYVAAAAIEGEIRRLQVCGVPPVH